MPTNRRGNRNQWNRLVASWKRNPPPPPVSSLDEYQNAKTPQKHNTITLSSDQDLLKAIYRIERNAKWREMLVRRVKDAVFLIEAAKKDKEPRVRKWAAIYVQDYALFKWMQQNDPDQQNQKYAKDRLKRYPSHVRLIMDLETTESGSSELRESHQS